MRSRLVVLALVLCHGCFVDRSGLGARDAAVGDARVDGRVPDGCAPAPERCDGADDDCDGRVDEGFDTSSDPAHCGACDAACDPDPPNAAAVCRAGVCALSCDAGFGDCDADPNNGCETSLRTSTDCGACDAACGPPLPFCAGSPPVCASTCDPGESQCGDACVDPETDPAHCGGCGVLCPTAPRASAICAAGSCSLACDPGYDDCDPGAAGCETATGTSVTNCGGCGVACPSPPNAAPTCSAGACGFTCDARFADCNGAAADGCEASLSDDATCGSCGTACAGDEMCSGGACVPACDRGCGTCGLGCCTDGCAVGATCGFTCTDACGCAFDCADNTGGCTFNCSGGATCGVDCRRAADCDATCAGGADCVVDCRDLPAGADCGVDCSGGASCVVDCRGAMGACGITRCTGGPTITCGDGRFACNTTCP